MKVQSIPFTDCVGAQQLMSPFIDSMVTPDEAGRLESHVDQCEPCQRQLQSFISMRNLLSRVERADPPQDLVLDTRVKLSRERNRNYWDRLETQLNNVLKPLAIPALMGVSLTMLFFGMVFGGLVSNSTVMAQSRFDEPPMRNLYKHVRTTEPTMIWFANDGRSFDEPLMIVVHVGTTGRGIDYQIIAGPQDPATEKWIKEVLSLAQFTPATKFGKPVESNIVLSFIAVRS